MLALYTLRQRIALYSIAIGLGLLAPQMALSDISLKFGAYAADKPTETVRLFKPILKYLEADLSKRLGEPVNITTEIASDYNEGIEDLALGHVDFARFGPASYITAKMMNKDVGILAMESENGGKTFKGIIAVHKDSDLKSLSDLNGRSFAFGDELSTIGRYLAQSHLLDAGITSRELKRYSFLGRHDRVGTSVGKGDYDAGALKISTFDKLVAKGVPLRKLKSFDNVTKPWLHRANLEPRIITALTASFLELSDPSVLANIAESGFLHGEDADFQVIRQAMQRSADFGQ